MISGDYRPVKIYLQKNILGDHFMKIVYILLQLYYKYF